MSFKQKTNPYIPMYYNSNYTEKNQSLIKSIYYIYLK